MKKSCNGWMRFGSCVAAGMLALGAAHAETGITNTVDGVTNNVSGSYYVGAGPRPGAGGADTLSDTNVPPKGPFYKLQVELP